MQDLDPWPGLEPDLLRWERRVLALGPPGPLGAPLPRSALSSSLQVSTSLDLLQK